MRTLWLTLILKLQGRKTYLLAALAGVVATVLVAVGRATPASAVGALILFVGLFSATLRAALQRHHDEEIHFLSEVLALGVALRTHNAGAALTTAAEAAQDGASIAGEMDEERAK